MKQQARALAGRAVAKMAPGTAGRLRSRRQRGSQAPSPAVPAEGHLSDRLRAVEREVQELRQLNRRLSDALDVMTELLVPAMDRDDAKVAAALDRLGATTSHRDQLP